MPRHPTQPNLQTMERQSLYQPLRPPTRHKTMHSMRGMPPAGPPPLLFHYQQATQFIPKNRGSLPLRVPSFPGCLRCSQTPLRSSSPIGTGPHTTRPGGWSGPARPTPAAPPPATPRQHYPPPQGSPPPRLPRHPPRQPTPRVWVGCRYPTPGPGGGPRPGTPLPRSCLPP